MTVALVVTLVTIEASSEAVTLRAVVESAAPETSPGAVIARVKVTGHVTDL